MNAAVPTRLTALRKAMQSHGVDACLVPSADPHLSEYLPAHWQARQWLCGFTGSAGTLVVCANVAGLWTDSRYFEQAGQQLAGSGVQLMRLKVSHAPEYIDWLCTQLAPGQTVAVAGDSLALGARRQLETRLQVTGAHLRCDIDLPGQVWPQRPPLPQAPVLPHDAAFAGRPRSERLAALRTAVAATGASHHLLSSLDDIAWLTCLRGSDVDYNPVFLAHLLLDAGHCTLFVDATRLHPGVAEALAADGVTLAGYAKVEPALAALAPDSRLLLDPQRVVVQLAAAVAPGVALVEQANPSTAMKALKRTDELVHIRQTMREDGAALVGAFHRIERAVVAGEPLTELDVDAILHQARAARPGFVGESFATIAGYMANGALPHYRATAEHHARIGADGLLLVDSGGQYLGGTTDITRVWAFGATTAEQRSDCTRVLKGMIALSRAQFPEGTSGPQLDALARAPVWAGGGDYGHGTGHGVGYFLNVHEGPHAIRPPTAGAALVPLAPGMVCSIEPGLYKAGRHGIRHENLVVVHETGHTEFGRFLGFETLTLCPIDTRALDPGLLEPTERAWLDAYHGHVLEQLSPLLDEADNAWLARRCQPLAPPV